MENAPSGTDGNNHINLLTGLKFSLFKDKEVSSVWNYSMCMCRSMFCHWRFEAKKHSRWTHPLREQRTLLSFPERIRSFFCWQLLLGQSSKGTDSYPVIGLKESGHGWCSNIGIVKTESLVIPLQQTNKSRLKGGALAFWRAMPPNWKAVTEKPPSDACQPHHLIWQIYGFIKFATTRGPLHWCWALMSLSGGRCSPCPADAAWWISRLVAIPVWQAKAWLERWRNSGLGDIIQCWGGGCVVSVCNIAKNPSIYETCVDRFGDYYLRPGWAP